MGAAGAGVGIFVAAMKDAKDVLEDLGPRFTALQQDISLNFWGEAADAIRYFANSALDALGPSIGNVAAEMGMMTAAVADVATEHIPGFERSLNYLAQALNIGGDGAGAFTNGLLTMGEVGAKYLPSIAGWANDVAYSFEAWATKAAESGKMDQAIRNGAKAFGTLKDITVDLGGIIGGLFTAMAAGSAPIDSIATALDRANAAVNGPLFQSTLTSLFSSMADAAGHAFAGVGSLGAAFVSLEPTLAQILPMIGQIVETGLKGISAALQDPAFQTGLTSFFSGVLTAVQALAPAMPALGEAFGAIATVAGQLLVAVAPLIAALVEQLAPVFTQLAVLLAPIIEQLGAALMPVIQALGPLLMVLFEALAPIVNELLAAIVPLIGPIVEAIMAVLVPAIQLISTVIQALMPVVTAVLQTIAELFSANLQIISGMIKVVMSVITGDWSGAWEGIKQIFTGIWNAIVAIFTGFGRILVSVAVAAWNLLGSAISAAASWIGGIITSWIGNVGRWISEGWNYVSTATSNAWSGLVRTLSSWISNAVNAVRSLPSSIKNFFSNAGSWLVSAGKSVIQGFVNGIKSMFGSVKSTLGGLTSKLTSWKGPAPVDRVILKDAGRLVMQGFIDGLESQYDAVKDSLTDFTDTLSDEVAPEISGTVSASYDKISARSMEAVSGKNNSMPKSSGRGATINITNNYPQAQPDSKVRDEVADGIRLASSI